MKVGLRGGEMEVKMRAGRKAVRNVEVGFEGRGEGVKLR